MPDSLTPDRARGVLRDAGLLLVALLPVLVLALYGMRGPVLLAVDLGPNDGAYLEGFDTHFEIGPEFATRWTERKAVVDMPFTVREGPVSVAWRGARMLPSSAVVDVTVGARPSDHAVLRGGRFEVRRQPVPGAGAVPARITFDVDPNDNGALGIRLDWVALEVGEGGRVLFRGLVRWSAVLLVAGAFVLFRLAGWSGGPAVASSAVLALAATAWALLGPFAFAHVASRVWAPALLLAGVGVFAARRTGVAALPAIVLASYLLKAGGIFHPAFYYPDVQNDRRYTVVFSDATGSVAERGVIAQKTVNTGYPRFVAGKPYAFPYSPVFFVPFSWMHKAGLSAHGLEDAFRHVSVAAGALEVLAVCALARRLFGPESGTLAALLAALMPPLYSRLMFAMWPTIVGHLFDTLVMVAAIPLVVEPAGRAWVQVGAWQLAGYLTYIASLFNITGFTAWLAVLDRHVRVKVLALTVATAAFTVLALYFDFTRAFVLEIIPAMLRGEASPKGPSGAPSPGLLGALGRILLFYGYGTPALALAGAVLAWRRGSRTTRLVLGAYTLAFVTQLLMRGFIPGLFKDLKEITFAAPLMAITAGLALEELRRWRGRAPVVLLVVGIAAFTAGRYWTWWHEYRPVVMNGANAWGPALPPAR